MASITLITGSIDEIIDPFGKLDYSELYYEFWHEVYDNPDLYRIERTDFPMRKYGQNRARIVQYLGSGKTLMGMHILAEKAYHNLPVKANLNLIWHNFEKPKDQWQAKINTIEDFQTADNCTLLLDDIRSTISHFQCKEAELVSEIANAGRKLNLDIISTAQREIMFPKDLRDMATEWIVPVIRVRDMTKWTPDNTGLPIEMIALHFDGGKTFTYMSEPIVGLNRLFEAYSTLQRAIGLKVPEKEKKQKKQKGTTFDE